MGRKGFRFACRLITTICAHVGRQDLAFVIQALTQLRARSFRSNRLCFVATVAIEDPHYATRFGVKETSRAVNMAYNSTAM